MFPFSVMDLLLALTENEVHEFVWSDFLLDEWERVIVREGQRTVRVTFSSNPRTAAIRSRVSQLGRWSAASMADTVA